jgi:hypothetical protein
MPKAQVVNNCQGPHYIQLSNASKDGKVANNLLVLRPGMNLVDAETLKTARKSNKGFESLFKLKIPSSVAKEALVNSRNFGRPMLEERGKPLDDAAPVVSLPYPEAEEIVNLTEDTDLLNEWKLQCNAEKNSALIKCIDERIKFLASRIAG